MDIKHSFFHCLYVLFSNYWWREKATEWKGNTLKGNERERERLVVWSLCLLSQCICLVALSTPLIKQICTDVKTERTRVPLSLMPDENTASMSHWPSCGGPITFPLQITGHYMGIFSKCHCSECWRRTKAATKKWECCSGTTGVVKWWWWKHVENNSL